MPEWEVNANVNISSAREWNSLLGHLAKLVVGGKEDVEAAWVEVDEPAKACAE